MTVKKLLILMFKALKLPVAKGFYIVLLVFECSNLWEPMSYYFYDLSNQLIFCQ